MIKILQRIKKAYHLETDAEVADFLGIKPSTLSMQKNRGRLNLKRIVQECSDLNKNWLFDGVGSMRQSSLEKEVTHIPIYSSLTIENYKPNFRESVKAGTLMTENIDRLYQFADFNQVIGYVVDGSSVASVLQKDDIAIIDINSSLSVKKVHLFSFEEQLVFGRLKKMDGNYIAEYKDGKQRSLDGNGANHIIGKLIGMMRRT